MINKDLLRYYYPTYRYSPNTYFRIKLGTIGHIMLEDKILCGEQLAEKETFTSYTIEYRAKPGYKLCDRCTAKRAEITGADKKTVAMSDQEKLKRWLKATGQVV